MATFVTYTANGSNDTFNIPFPYIERGHVVVSVNGVVQPSSAYTYPTISSIKLNTVPSAGIPVEIRRSTPAFPITEYQSGGVLTKTDLETDSKQALFLIEEFADNKMTEAQVVELIEEAGAEGLGAGILRNDLQSSLDSKGSALVTYMPPGSGALARSLQSRLRDQVSVHDFMTAEQIADTKLTSPVLDHTAALQAAINAQAVPLVKDAARLHIPAGHYRISAELVVTFNGALYGDGVETTTITLLNATQNGIRVPYSGTLQIHGIHIKAGVAKTAGAGIKVEGVSAASASSQTRIFNCKIDQQYVGIDMSNSGFWSIRDTIVSDAYIGIRSDNTQNFDGGDNVIGEGTIIYRTGSDAAAGTRGVLHVGAGGLKLVGVKILGFDRGYEMVPRVGATYVVDTQITGCSMEFQNICIALDQQNAGTSIAQFTITGNQLHPRTHGVYLRGNVGGGTVSGNVIGVPFANAIGVFLGTNGANTPGNVAIVGNVFPGSGGASTIGIHGGFVAGSNGNVAHGNRITGVTTDYVAFFGRHTDATYTFANLPAAENGSIVYCSDGTMANPVAGGGTGCLAKRINGVWVGN